VQYVDARDLAGFLASLGAERTTGVFNAAAPRRPFRSLVQTIAGVTGRSGPLVPLPADHLADEGVEGWRDLPLWLPPEDRAFRGLLSVDTTRAVAHGLRIRDLAETALDTLSWANAAGGTLGAGLDRERDAELAQRYLG
jgi:2'-hydroxyisoflavone reductase